jgi:rubrerythrin
MKLKKGSKTEQNLKDAFAGESQANRRYLYFAAAAARRPRARPGMRTVISIT